MILPSRCFPCLDQGARPRPQGAVFPCRVEVFPLPEVAEKDLACPQIQNGASLSIGDDADQLGFVQGTHKLEYRALRIIPLGLCKTAGRQLDEKVSHVCLPKGAMDSYPRLIGDQRDPGLCFIQGVAVAEEVVVKERFAMVGNDHDGGPAVDAEVFEALYHGADGLVRHGDGVPVGGFEPCAVGLADLGAWNGPVVGQRGHAGVAVRKMGGLEVDVKELGAVPVDLARAPDELLYDPGFAQPQAAG